MRRVKILAKKNRPWVKLIVLIIGTVIFCLAGCSSSSNDETSPSGTDDTIQNTSKVVMINLGDSYGNGVQSGAGNVNQYTQINSYPQRLANQLKKVVSLEWNNPLLDMDKKRLDATVIPYNVAVDGATIQSLLEETSDESPYIAELLQPIPANTGTAITQLEAAEYVAGLYDDSVLKIITLFIGGNDILGTVTAKSGTELTTEAINAFLADTSNGHDLDSIKANLSEIVERLTQIPNSQVFIANLPSVTGIAGLFDAEDIERLAIFDNPSVTVMSDGQYLGLGPFTGLASDLATDNEQLNSHIQQVMATDGNYLTSDEVALISTRANEISTYISELVSQSANLYLVDVVSMFDQLLQGEISISGDVIGRGYNAGLFSMDGFHPSNSGYALIANEFIKAINNSAIVASISPVDLETIWASDPYHDQDHDGYVAGPGLTSDGRSIILPFFNALIDCDDSDSSVYAPFPGNYLWSQCQ